MIANTGRTRSATFIWFPMGSESLSPNAVVMKSVKIACASMIPGALNEDFLGKVSVPLTAPEAQDRASYWLKLGDWGRCPLWFISGHFATRDPCPLYPQKRTLAVH